MSLLPFTAVVGQDRLKTALILAAIEPRLAGVLVSGPRGMAKSTLARGLAGLDRRADGRFVTLPLGADEARLVGTLDLSKALADAEVVFQPGLLADAHGGYLYIDEVNLLADPLVDLLLDVAASRINRIARDGIVREHPADFVLVGTMNPDEGDLRPQFSDRFGLCVVLDGVLPAAERRAIVDQRLAFEADADGFVADHAEGEAALATRIENARDALAEVTTPDAIKDDIAARCEAADVEGVRADIHWRQAARAHAAWQDHPAVTPADVDAVAEFVLCHRRGPNADAANAGANEGGGGPTGSGESSDPPDDNQQSNAGDWGAMPPRHVVRAKPFRLATEMPPADRPLRPGAPRRATRTGRTAGAVADRRKARRADDPDADAQLDWFATLVQRGLARGQPSEPVFRVPARRERLLECVLLDTSASTLGRAAQAAARAGASAIAESAYRARRELAVLAFGGDRLDWLVPAGRAPRTIDPALDEAPAGGGTPLAAALAEARRAIRRHRSHRPALRVRAWLMTDGRTRARFTPDDWPWELIVVDSETARVPLAGARRLADALGGRYMTLADLGGDA